MALNHCEPITEGSNLSATESAAIDRFIEDCKSLARKALPRPMPEGARRTECSECGFTYGTHAAWCSELPALLRKQAE